MTRRQLDIAKDALHLALALVDLLKTLKEKPKKDDDGD